TSSTSRMRREPSQKGHTGRVKQRRPGLYRGGAQRVEKPQFKRTRLNWGGGARGGSRPPRVESNAPQCLCRARLAASGARTFAPLCGAKVTVFLKAVEKVLELFRQPERRPGLCRGGA